MRSGQSATGWRRSSTGSRRIRCTVWRGEPPAWPGAVVPDADAIRLGAFPYYPNNPWQDLMYADSRARGVHVVELDSLDDRRWLESGHGVAAFVLHVNWTAAISQRAPDVVSAFRAVEAAIGTMTELRDAGVRIVWTVHNVLPHDLAYLLPEVRLCRWLAAHADAVTIMNESTPRLVRPWYRLREDAVRRMPHPSYVGRYPEGPGRERARRSLEIPADARVALMLGTLRPYKGIEDVVAAMPRIRSSDPQFRLLVAGERGPGFSDEAVGALSATDGVTAHVGYLDAEQVATWCEAADVMLLPYRAGLNSGVALLAATFGLPVVATSSDVGRELDGADWVRLIDPESDPAAAIVEAVSVLAADPSSSRSAREAAEALRPEIVAARFSELVLELAGTPS